MCISKPQQSFQEGYEGIGKPRNRNGIESFEEVPMSVALLTYMGWGIIIPSQNPEKNREVLLFFLDNLLCSDVNFFFFLY